MAKNIKPLTDAQCKTTPDPMKVIVKRDGGGLYLEIKPSGTRHWYVEYRVFDAEKAKRVRSRVALGAYPLLSLADARTKRDDIQRKAKGGINPSKERVEARKAAVAAARGNPLFSVVADEWLAFTYPATAAINTTRNAKRFVRYLVEGVGAAEGEGNPANAIGKTPIRDVTAGQVLAVLDACVVNGRHHNRRRIQGAARGVLGYAFKRYIEVNPLAGVDFKPYAKHKTRKKKRMARHKPEEFAIVLRKIGAFKGACVKACVPLGIGRSVDGRVIRTYLNLLALTFVRPSELRLAEWTEFAAIIAARFDLDGAIWEVPYARLKQRTERARAEKGNEDPHKVPLARQALAILHELHELTGGGRFLFPSARKANKPLTTSTVHNYLERMGINSTDEQTLHGFRASARTMLTMAKGVSGYLFRERAVEYQLNHIEDDEYFRDDLIDERATMLQWWADRLDVLREGTDAAVHPLKKVA